jgi:hypothetical protein
MGQYRNFTFPMEPIVSTNIEGQKSEFTFFWMDGATNTHAPMDVDIEIFAINHGLQIGRSVVIEIRDESD